MAGATRRPPALGHQPSAAPRGAQAGPDKAGDYHVHTGGGSCRYACCYLCHCRGADRTSAPSSTLPIPHITPSLTMIRKQQALCCASVVLLVCCCCAAVVLLLLGCAPACGCVGTVVHRPAVVLMLLGCAPACCCCSCLQSVHLPASSPEHVCVVSCRTVAHSS